MLELCTGSAPEFHCIHQYNDKENLFRNVGIGKSVIITHCDLRSTEVGFALPHTK